jgi:TatD DNase family protein
MLLNLMVNLIDAHCHLESDRFKEDLKDVIKRAGKAGVKRIIVSGVNPSTNRKVLDLVEENYHILVTSFGIYPVDAVANSVEIGEFLRYVEKFDIDEELKWIEENSHKCVAIGEVGLDYKIVEGHNDLQKENFRKCIALALKLDMPLIIHSRKGEADALGLLEEMGAKKVMLHCFHGRKRLIKKAVELGYYISIPPVITRLDHFKMLVEIVPLENLLTETDAPYLSPVAGTRNEPANVAISIKEIAKIKELSEEEVARQIWKNSERLFGKW